MWFGLWWGGAGYSPPDPSDLEEFTSIADARDKLLARYRHGYSWRSHFAFVDRAPADVLTPCVSEDCEITLYGSPDALDYPTKRIFLGPRQGVRSERC